MTNFNIAPRAPLPLSLYAHANAAAPPPTPFSLIPIDPNSPLNTLCVTQGPLPHTARAISLINSTPATLRDWNSITSLIDDTEHIRKHSPETYYGDNVFGDVIAGVFEETSGDIFENVRGDAQVAPSRETLWDLAPAQQAQNANVLACLNKDLAAAQANLKNQGGWLNTVKSSGLALIRQQLHWLVSAATFTPNGLWCINKMARWRRFLPGSANSHKIFALPNPCRTEHLLRTNTDSHYSDLHPIKGNWLQGYPSNTDTPLEDHAHNARIAEVFTRLAMNDCQNGATDATDPTDANTDNFHLDIDGQQFTSLNALTDYLEAAGYQLEISTASRVADFFGLHYHRTNDDGVTQTLPVPLPVFFQTQWHASPDDKTLTDPTDKPRTRTAALPVMHSETLLRISAPRQAADTAHGETATPFATNLIWLMGVEGIGFNAGGKEKLQAWSQPQEKLLVTGKQAWELVNVMGLLTRAMTDIGREYRLPNDAYFAEGACNDFAGLLQAYMGQPIEAFPLTMPTDFLKNYLTRAINNAGTDKKPACDTADLGRAKKLRDILDNFPNDLYRPKDQRQRALNTLPWQKGEPSAWPAVDKERQKLYTL